MSATTDSKATAPKTLTIGARVHWRGDFANNPQTGTVTALDDSWMWVRWDGADKVLPMPRGLLSSPRWTIVN